MMNVLDPFLAEGPCACPACYVHGCDYCQYLGCCLHIDGTPHFVPPTDVPIPMLPSLYRYRLGGKDQ